MEGDVKSYPFFKVGNFDQLLYPLRLTFLFISVLFSPCIIFKGRSRFSGGPCFRLFFSNTSFGRGKG